MAKTILVLAVLAACVTARAGGASFEQWAAAYGKSYASDKAEAAARRAWADNVKSAAQLTAASGGATTFAAGVFADESAQQFAARRLMRPRPAVRHPPSRYFQPAAAALAALPTAFDWRNKSGIVGPVRNQGSVGTCWAFSTSENVAGVWAVGGNAFVELSVEQLVECAANEQVSTGHACCGVFGGWPYLAFQYIVSAGGLDSETAYPYCLGTDSCYPCMPPGFNKTLCGPGPEYCNKTRHCDVRKPTAAQISGWKAIGDDADSIAAALQQHGPLSVMLNAQGLQSYSGGVYQPSSCNPSALDHAVLLVGWNDDSSAGGPYWIVKNSWGASWGEQGYFYIRKGEGTCGINTAVTTAVL
eukprot:PLAT1269.1.p1 GENE.PLAT1269.1~~PLAT1269.1.p1  ORF type:complete len:367 (+),score=130.34 PLAT1269.1:30-1103(+)